MIKQMHTNQNLASNIIYVFIVILLILKLEYLIKLICTDQKIPLYIIVLGVLAYNLIDT